MPAVVNLTFKSQDWTRAIRQLKARSPRAIARALNRSGASAKTLLARETARDLGLKVSVVKDAIRVFEANPGQETVTLFASGRRIPLIQFNARGPEPSRGRGRGVSARTPTARYPQAFITTTRSGHRGVFQRASRSRLPVYELYGPSIAHVASKHAEASAARGEEQLIKNLRSEFRFALQEAAGG